VERAAGNAQKQARHPHLPQLACVNVSCSRFSDSFEANKEFQSAKRPKASLPCILLCQRRKQAARQERPQRQASTLLSPCTLSWQPGATLEGNIVETDQHM
jgi:hypothetical protein